ncbi:hypothetical protein PAPYR_1775 [Paratrimastix pyriformis]|uniref:Uncharacterized protein n=1 Tax=Paratrimastix pyriformis TaxID=342808 RepID=A0ABQ8UVT0_9EUKA|nr:hypothetical protein PAPYR_1775 [Paratrimastix pyriformis]
MRSYGARILVTEHTLAALGPLAGQFTARPVDCIIVKGKSRPVALYEVIDGDSELVARPKRELLPHFMSGLLAFAARRFGEAAGRFESCLQIADDRISRGGAADAGMAHDLSFSKVHPVSLTLGSLARLPCGAALPATVQLPVVIFATEVHELLAEADKRNHHQGQP